MGPALPILATLLSTTIKGVAEGFLDEGTARNIVFFGANLLSAYGEATAELEAFASQIESIVAAKRAPTDEEWAEWESRSQTATDRIKAAAAARRA